MDPDHHVSLICCGHISFMLDWVWQSWQNKIKTTVYLWKLESSYAIIKQSEAPRNEFLLSLLPVQHKQLKHLCSVSFNNLFEEYVYRQITLWHYSIALSFNKWLKWDFKNLVEIENHIKNLKVNAFNKLKRKLSIFYQPYLVNGRK